MKIIKSASYEKIAAKRGVFKYKCDDCGEFTNLSQRERGRASRPRCQSCGSTWLDPVTENAVSRIQEDTDGYNERVNLMKRKQNF